MANAISIAFNQVFVEIQKNNVDISYYQFLSSSSYLVIYC